MIKAVSRKPLGKYFKIPCFKFTTSQNEQTNIQNNQPARFNGFMLPLLYPLWISSNTKIDLSPKISEVI